MLRAFASRYLLLRTRRTLILSIGLNETSFVSEISNSLYTVPLCLRTWATSHVKQNSATNGKRRKHTRLMRDPAFYCHLHFRSNQGNEPDRNLDRIPGKTVFLSARTRQFIRQVQKRRSKRLAPSFRRIPQQQKRCINILLQRWWPICSYTRVVFTQLKSNAIPFILLQTEVILLGTVR